MVCSDLALGNYERLRTLHLLNVLPSQEGDYALSNVEETHIHIIHRPVIHF
jgi:hypothetical protein